MRRVYWGLAAGLLLVSCREGGDTAVPPQPPATPGATESGTAETPRAAGARAVVEETDDFLFEYSYPQEAGDIPELAGLLDDRLTRLRDELAAQSAEARDDARDNGFPYNKYSNEVIWKVVADTPGYLSLSATNSTYTGGAHGNYGFGALVWDKVAGRALRPESFFESVEELDAAVEERLCELLNRERASRRGEPVEKGGNNPFDACVPLDETTILLGSSNGRVFNRIGVLMAPYVAGPYSDGSYELTLDMTDAMLETVKEERRSAFATRN
jgi:hypothetical protein